MADGGRGAAVVKPRPGPRTRYRAPSDAAYRAWFDAMLPLARSLHRNGCDADTIAEELGLEPDDASALWAKCDDPDADDVIGYAEPEPEGDDGHGDYGYPDDWAYRANPREV